MNAKTIFKAIRRSYRVAHNTPILSEGGIAVRIAATGAIRAFTGKWDTCEPVGRSFVLSQCNRSNRRTSKGNACYSPFVAAACTRWMKKN